MDDGTGLLSGTAVYMVVLPANFQFFNQILVVPRVHVMELFVSLVLAGIPYSVCSVYWYPLGRQQKLFKD